MMLRIRPLAKTQAKYKIAILIPLKSYDLNKIKHFYTSNMAAKGISLDDILVISLKFNAKNKAPVSLIREHLKYVEKALTKYGVTHVLICDGSYFKVIAKQGKTEPHYGYALPSMWKEITAVASVNYTQLMYKPELQLKINMSVEALERSLLKVPGLFEDSILKSTLYPTTSLACKEALDSLHSYPELTCDLETFSLRVNDAHIASIAFAYNETSGISFILDTKSKRTPDSDSMIWRDKTRRSVVKKFLETYKGKLIFHNSPYDIKVLAWELFMEHPMDIEGMLRGLDILFRDMEDTKILAYLANNSTAGNSLSLKDLAFEYTGNYALEEIADVSKISPAKLREYNLTDAAATFWVYNKYYSRIIADHKELYEDLFKPALKVITQMELTGMPLNMGTVLNVKHDMETISNTHRDAILQHPLIISFTDVLRDDAAVQANKVLKKLRKDRNDFIHLIFNPGSTKQLRMLCFEFLKLPKQGTTDTGLPSTKAKDIKKLITLTSDQNIKDLLEHINKLSEVDKILTTFIPAFMTNSVKKDGWYYLHGGFNLGGTRTGRLSSSHPNLTNIPSTGTKYAKHIKTCFEMPPPKNDSRWLMVGADYSALEERVGTLQTKDPNRLKVYTAGFDGHCMRAYKYFGSEMPDIQQAMTMLDVPGNFYKITHDDGTEEYLHENALSENAKESLKI